MEIVSKLQRDSLIYPELANVSFSLSTPYILVKKKPSLSIPTSIESTVDLEPKVSFDRPIRSNLSQYDKKDDPSIEKIKELIPHYLKNIIKKGMSF